MKTMKIFFTTLIILIITNSSFGQSAGNAIYNNPYVTSPRKVNVNVNNPSGNYVILQADVMINVNATSYTAIFSATQNGITSTETDSLLTIRLELIKDGLKQIGIKESDIHIDVISFVPSYSLKLDEKKFSKTANEIPIGFQMKKNIHIIFYNHDKLSEIVALMAKSEIYDIVKVDYNLANIQAAYDTLRKAAVDIIKMKEEIYPKIGLHIDVENMADGFNVAYPLERYSSYTAFYTGSSIEEVKVAKKKKKQAKNVYITGKKATININATDDDDDDSEFIIKHSDKNKTIYYNRVPYNQFDLVMNADFAEARIQFFYTLKVRYTAMNMEKYQTLKEKEKKEKEETNKGWFKK